MHSVRNIIIAIIGAVCGVAGTIAVELPGGKFQEGAAAVADRCEQAGFPAYPRDGGMPGEQLQPGPVLEVPVPVPAGEPGAEGSWQHLVPTPASSSSSLAHPPAYRYAGLAWPPAQAWRGQARGWA
jgi:hypothetical protein